MSELWSFLKNFFRNKGQYVFVSLLVAKLCAFASSLYIIRLLPVEEYGKMSIVASVFAIFSSVNGLGSSQGLLRFGSIATSSIEKKYLSQYFLKTGFAYQCIITILFLLCAIFYIPKYSDILWIFVLFSIRLVGYYFFNHAQSDLRIRNDNRAFARLNNIINIGGLIISLLGAYAYGLTGYLIGMAAVPFISLFWLKKKDAIDAMVFNKTEMWRYAFRSAGNALLSDALFSLDILLLGFLLSESAVAEYRVAIFIPSNITFLSLTFMQADFPVLAKNYRDKSFLKNYIFNYYKLFIPLCAIIFTTGVLLNKTIITFFFKDKYSDAASLFVILLAAFVLNMLFRNLYGNLTSAVGKIHYNTKVSFGSLIFLIVSGYFLTKEFGVVGMVWALSLTLFISGISLMLCFYGYFRKLK